MEALKGIRIIEGLESSLERMYKALARRHGSDKEAAAFFSGLAKDEHTHLEMARMEIRMVRSAGYPVGEAVVDEAEVRRVLGIADRLIKEDMPLDEALRLVLEIENSAAELYVQTALKESDPAISRLISTMSGTFEDHRETVRAFLEDHGINAEALLPGPEPAPTGPRPKQKALLVNNASLGTDALRVYSGAIESSGYEAVSLPGAKEAETMLRDETSAVSLVFVDLESADDENLELIRLIRGLPAHSGTPVVVFTTNYAVEFMRKVKAAGATRILYKMSTPPEKLAELLKPG